MAAENRALSLILIGLTLIGAAAFTAWFLTNFERRTEEVAVGAAAPARRNPFLAAERFLARLDIAVESRAGRALLRQPPPTTDTVVVNGLGPLNAQGRATLRGWLRGGGRLVVAATDRRDRERRPSDRQGGDSADLPDDLLAEFGIRLTPVEIANGRRSGPDRAPARMRWGEARPPLAVDLRADRALTVEDGDAALLVQADGQTRLVQKAVGAGLLTVVSDNRFLTNERIGRHDHALLLAYLVRPAPGGKVWLLYDAAVPWLGALLWAAAPAALTAAGVLVLVWAWSLGARLGPLGSVPDRRRRDLIEHLDAAAAFLWRHGRAARLVAATQRQVQGAWQRRRPDLRHLAPADQVAVIARASALPVAAVAAALQAQADARPGVIDQARILKALWQGSRPPGAPGRLGAPDRGPARPPRPTTHLKDQR